MEIYYNKAAKHWMKQQIRYQRGKKSNAIMYSELLSYWWDFSSVYKNEGLMSRCEAIFLKVVWFLHVYVLENWSVLLVVFVFHQCMDALDRKEWLHISIWSLCFIRSWWINFTCHCFDYACRSDWGECGKCCFVWPD